MGESFKSFATYYIRIVLLFRVFSWDCFTGMRYVFLSRCCNSARRICLLDVFRKSWWAFVGLIILFFHPVTFDKATFGGALIVYFVFSSSLAVYPYLPAKLKNILLFLGRNSLALYVFSPIFTICSKVFIPYLSFDPTRLLFLSISLLICIFGCLITCKVLDLLHVSPLIFGRKHIII